MLEEMIFRYLWFLAGPPWEEIGKWERFCEHLSGKEFGDLLNKTHTFYNKYRVDRSRCGWKIHI